MGKAIGKSGSGRRRGISISAIALISFAFPAPTIDAASAPAQIEFLNPSSFALNSAERIIVSDRAVTRPREGAETYRISAWTRNAPPDAGVEFELLSGGLSIETLDQVTTIGVDTFDYNWNIPPTLPDGPYTLRATLFADNEAVDHVDADITIVRLGDKASVDYPTVAPSSPDWPGGATFGTYRPLAEGLPDEGIAEKGEPVGNIEASHTKGAEFSSGTTRVRAFYTLSEPGTPPQWRTCGTEKTPGHPVPSSAANNGVRCTLASADHQGKVTAVAVLANSSPAEYDPAANQAGDAIRVLNHYEQSLTSFSFTEGAGEVIEEGTDGGFPCHTLTVHLEDQIGREIAGANVDVHATGPTDKLRIDTGLATASGVTHADRNHALSEPGHDCFGGGGQTAGHQSEHQVLGSSDVKHVESDAAGTSDEGDWSFSFKVPADQVTDASYTVEMTAFVDETDDGCHANDDAFTASELSATAAVGLDRAPVTPTPFVAQDLERCDRLPALRTVTLDSSRAQVRAGGDVTLSGQVTSAADCAGAERVRLKVRPGGNDGSRFRAIDAMKTDASGAFAFRDVDVKRTRDYIAVTPRTDECAWARSPIVTVKASR
jgi:hypothetical protein